MVYTAIIFDAFQCLTAKTTLHCTVSFLLSAYCEIVKQDHPESAAKVNPDLIWSLDTNLDDFHNLLGTSLSKIDL